MKNFNHFQQAIEARIEMNDDSFEKVQTAILARSDDASNFHNNLKWKVGDFMFQNHSRIFWSEIKELFENEVSTEEKVSDVQEVLKLRTKQLMRCDLCNMRVDGHGIDELAKHKALAKFVNDLNDIVNFFIKEEE